MSAIENLKLVCKIKEIPFDKIDEKLKSVNLYDRKNSKFKTFSLGMKQRLAIASALLNDPEILILDEPTNGLDPQGIHEIRRIITEIASKGTTILLASHLLDEVEKVCTHVVVIRNGLKLYSGRVDEMSSSFGIIELSTENTNNELFSALKNYEGIDSVNNENGKVYLKLGKNISTSELNKYLISKDVVLSHLVKRKPTLEQQFLDLTNNKN
jgi:ABC-2 type transport system ATP-binding protein